MISRWQILSLSQWLLPLPMLMPMPMPLPTTHVEQVKWDMYEQAQWVEGTLFKPLSQMKEISDTLSMLSRRMNNLEAYLGLQDGAQPIVLNNRLSEHVYHLQGGPSWRGMTDRIEAEEDFPTASAVADSANRMEA